MLEFCTNIKWMKGNLFPKHGSWMSIKSASECSMWHVWHWIKQGNTKIFDVPRYSRSLFFQTTKNDAMKTTSVLRIFWHFLIEKLFLAKVQIFSEGHIFLKKILFSLTQRKKRKIFSNVCGLLRKYDYLAITVTNSTIFHFHIFFLQLSPTICF